MRRFFFNLTFKLCDTIYNKNKHGEKSVTNKRTRLGSSFVFLENGTNDQFWNNGEVDEVHLSSP